MKKVLIIAIGLGLALGVLEARADAVQVICDGSESGGNEPRQYTYDVTGVGPLMEFMVGTNDLDAGNYTNLLTGFQWGSQPHHRRRGLKRHQKTTTCPLCIPQKDPG